MKAIYLCALLIALSPFSLVAQERVDGKPTELEWKSKEVNNALYWEQSPVSGKWESRKCSKMLYLGEGVNVANYHGLFTGVLDGDTYLFLDKRDYKWRYPELELEWMYARHIYAALLSSEDVQRIKSLPVGEVVTLTPAYVNDMSRANEQYSFPLFLSLTQTLKGVEPANSVPFITFKRVANSDGSEAVRFCFGAVTELIDTSYFEVSADAFSNLFIPDKKTTYK